MIVSFLKAFVQVLKGDFNDEKNRSVRFLTHVVFALPVEEHVSSDWSPLKKEVFFSELKPKTKDFSKIVFFFFIWQLNLLFLHSVSSSISIDVVFLWDDYQTFVDYCTQRDINDSGELSLIFHFSRPMFSRQFDFVIILQKLNFDISDFPNRTKKNKFDVSFCFHLIHNDFCCEWRLMFLSFQMRFINDFTADQNSTKITKRNRIQSCFDRWILLMNIFR